MFQVDRYGRFERMLSGFNYDPGTLSPEVMEILKGELPQPIYDEIKDINIPRIPDVVTVNVCYHQPRVEIWYN